MFSSVDALVAHPCRDSCGEVDADVQVSVQRSCEAEADPVANDASDAGCSVTIAGGSQWTVVLHEQDAVQTQDVNLTLPPAMAGAMHAFSLSMLLDSASSTPPAASSITVSPGCSAVLYAEYDFSGAKKTVEAGEHTFGNSRAVRLVPRASTASSWTEALESQHGAGSAANYPYDTCNVQCCDETVDIYLEGLHRTRELAMLGRNGEAADVAYALCEDSLGTLNPLSDCAAFIAVQGEACQMTSLLETSGDIFGAMPMWTYNSFDDDMMDAFDKMKGIQAEVITLAASDVQLSKVKESLEESRAAVDDQLIVMDADIRAAQDKLRATAMVVELMGELIESQRAEIAAMARPVLNGTRLQLERLQWMVATERSKALSAAMAPRYIWGLITSATNAVQDGIALVAETAQQALSFVLEEIIKPGLSLTCQVFKCLHSAADTLAESLVDGSSNAYPLTKSLGASGMQDSWLSLAREVERTSAPSPFFAELSADGGVHRLRRAAVSNGQGRLL